VVSTFDNKTIVVIGTSDLPTDRAFGAGDVVWSDDYCLGLTYKSCCVVMGSASYRTAVHEVLHSDHFGSLKHIDAEDNIMYPYASGATGDQLRYRPLDAVRSPGDDAPLLQTQEQWKQVREATVY